MAGSSTATGAAPNLSQSKLVTLDQLSSHGSAAARGLRQTVEQRRDVWDRALIVVPAIVLAWLGYRRRWLADDALIFTRPARQIVAGNGPVFNFHERAEPATSTLWQWLLAAVYWVTRWDLGKIAVYLGLVLSVAGLAIAIAATIRLHRPAGSTYAPWLLPAGLIVFLAIPPVWDFATSGLETGLETFWVAGAWWLLVRSRERLSTRQLFGGGVWLGLLPLVRPEFVIISLLFGGAIWLLQRPSRQQTIAWIGSGIAVPLAYEVFRAGYYGILVPLPGIAKEPGMSDWARGIHYIGDTLGAYWLWIPLILVIAALAIMTNELQRHRHELLIVAAPITAALIEGIYLARIGGDWMHARMVLPVLFLLLLPVLVIPMAEATTGALVAGLLVWAVFAVSPLRRPYDGPGTSLTNLDAPVQNARLLTISTTRRKNPVSFADWRSAASQLPPMQPGMLAYYSGRLQRQLFPMRAGTGYDMAVAGGYLGITGVVVPLNGYVADEFSLAYPIGAHFELVARGSSPGHEKWVPNAWMFADMGDPRLPPPAELALAPTPRVEAAELATGTTPQAVAAARRAMQCGKLHELIESVRAPLTPSRFWRNLVGSYGRTTLRIPADPFEAEARFCGHR